MVKTVLEHMQGLNTKERAYEIRNQTVKLIKDLIFGMNTSALEGKPRLSKLLIILQTGGKFGFPLLGYLGS